MMNKEKRLEILNELWEIEEELERTSKRVRDIMRVVLRLEAS